MAHAVSSRSANSIVERSASSDLAWSDDEGAPKSDSRFSCNICLDPVTEPVVTQCGHLYCWPCLYRWLEPGIAPAEAFWNIPVGKRIDPSRRCCPVCKADCSVPTIVPIYVRNEPSTPTTASGRKISPEPEVEHLTPEGERGEVAVDTTLLDQLGTPQPGLRQRLRFRSQDSEIPLDDVPFRPAAMSPVRPTNVMNTAASPTPTAPPTYRTPLSPTPNRASLSHGMVLPFLQFIQTESSPNNAVPPLHRRDSGQTSRESMQRTMPQDEASEFLSRLLLMLGSFVILCLLLF